MILISEFDEVDIIISWMKVGICGGVMANIRAENAISYIVIAILKQNEAKFEGITNGLRAKVPFKFGESQNSCQDRFSIV